MVVRVLQKLTGLSEKDAPQAGIAFIFFFCVLASYYIVQPMRDELGLLIGKEYLPRLLIASLLVMLIVNPIFAYLLNRSGRVRLVKSVYRFFAANIVLFVLVFKYLEAAGQMASHGEATRVSGFAFGFSCLFFLWAGVFNLFAMSVFWALMADIYTGDQSKKVFGFLGAGGTLGQMVGSGLVTFLVSRIKGFHLTNLLILSAVLLEVAVQAMLRITRSYEEPPRKPGEKKPHAFSGVTDILKSPYLIGICFYLFLYTFTSSFIYLQKQIIVDTSLSSRESRVGYFSNVNLAVGLMTFLIQLFLTGSFLSVIGISAGLTLVPLIGLIGFSALARRPDLHTIAILEIVRKTANYAIARPSREVLFTAVSRREKYLAKNFIDTVVYRAGDSIASGTFDAMFSVGADMSIVSLSAVGVSAVYLVVGLVLGRSHGRRSAEQKAALALEEELGRPPILESPPAPAPQEPAAHEEPPDPSSGDNPASKS
jgi:AAA family ATP:ADP antiporter